MITSLLMPVAATIALVAAGPIVDQSAPGFTGTTTAGDTISLDDFAGQTVVLEWTNHDCPYVKKHYGSGNMQALQKKATADGVVWLTIISSAEGKQGHVSAAQADELTTSRKAGPSHVILDESGAIGQLYEAKTTPHMYVIDPSKTLRYQGAIDSIPSANVADIARADNYVSAALASLKSEAPVVVKQSRPYGCSVKYKG